MYFKVLKYYLKMKILHLNYNETKYIHLNKNKNRNTELTIRVSYGDFFQPKTF